MSQRLDIGTFSCGRKNSLRAAIHWCYLLFDIVATYILLILEVQEAVASYYYAGVALWVMNNEHASREKIISMVIFFIFVHKNVYIELDSKRSKGLASHCKAKTTFTFYFSIINA